MELMKKFLLLLSTIILLSACNFDLDALRSDTDALIEESKESYDNIVSDCKESYYNIVEEIQEIQKSYIYSS